MDFKELTYILAIAKHQNITRAANELYISQPTLTRFLQNFEARLGTRLFVRNGHTWIPTYAGEHYIAKAQKLINLKNELDQEMDDIIRSDRSRLRIGMTRVRATYLLPQTLPVFSHMYPHVELAVTEADSDRLEEMLLGGSLDLAFFNGPLTNHELSQELICREELVLLMSADHPLTEKAVHRPDCQHPWIDLNACQDTRFLIQYPGQKTRLITDQLFASLAFTPTETFETGTLHTSAALAAEGYGVTLISESQLSRMAISGRCLTCSVGSPSTLIDFLAAYRSGSYLSRHAHAYMALVKNMVS